jgi:hypothetical protein
MVIPVMDHIDSFFATAATAAAPEEVEDEDEDMNTGEPSSNSVPATTRQPGAPAMNATSSHPRATAAPTRSSSSAIRPSAHHSGLATSSKPLAHLSASSGTTTPSSSSTAAAATALSTSHPATTSNPSETADPPPPTYHKAIQAAMTVAKKTLNRYYAKTDDAVLYRIAMGVFLLLTWLHVSHPLF